MPVGDFTEREWAVVAGPSGSVKTRGLRFPLTATDNYRRSYRKVTIGLSYKTPVGFSYKTPVIFSYKTPVEKSLIPQGFPHPGCTASEREEGCF
jgi:hypothetical protein